ncbi:histidine phosphotransferase family protein [Niveispirillum sp. KHB5.9]|uniref:histidine phosphotransferase family protein n=1 Tax=Niveispirillum sp. KHB5.9 TaxID=3400269 RepID=UPI003A855743
MVLGIRAVELLCSRLCHDLVGPIGAVNNGVELLDEGGDTGGEALDLIADSAETASARLRLYRVALGAAGGQSLTGGDARAVLEGWFRGGKIRLDWSAAPFDPPPGLLKAALLAALLAEETLPRGGTVQVTGGDGGLTVTASGTGCALRPEMGPALAGQVAEADLGPRSVLSYATPRIAAGYGLSFAVENPGGAGEVRMRIQPAGT